MNDTVQIETKISFDYLTDFLLSDYHERRNHTSLGVYGEQYAKRLLLDSGYLALKGNLTPFSGDLRTIDTQTFTETHVEVKTAYCSATGGYSFCLKKQGKTDICHSDYAILICIDRYLNHYVYCIHCNLIKNQSLKIPTHPNNYAGKYAPFLVRQNINFDDTRKVAALW